jgi:predicted  nucleic acid-binding Zn-ribbon protein
MAIAAANRCDYDTAMERAKSAQVLLLLERKGNVGLFFYLYWHFVLIGLFIFSVAGTLSYKTYQKFSVTRKIRNINKEEDNIKNLISSAQKNYFSGKISADEYRRTIKQHQSKLAKIKQERLSLRNKRIKMLKQQQVLHDLEIEKLQVENEIKKLQEQFYKSKKIPENEYKSEFKILNERLAEIEGEKITLGMLKQKESKKEKISNLFELPKKIIKKIKKTDKKGVLLIDSEIINKLKKEVSKRDCKGKWINLKFKSK